MCSAAPVLRSPHIAAPDHNHNAYDQSPRPVLRRIERELPGLIRFAARLLNDANAAGQIAEHALAATLAAEDHFSDGALVGAKLRIAITLRCLKACEADDRARAAATSRDGAIHACDWHAEWETLTPRALWGPVPESCFPHDILSLISQLPSPQRAALLLADGEGLDASGLAECLGVETNGARSILHSARQSLQQLILSQENTPPTDSLHSPAAGRTRFGHTRAGGTHPGDSYHGQSYCDHPHAG